MKLIKYNSRIDEKRCLTERKLIKYLEDDSLQTLKKDNDINEKF
jgi:hypothetical protein